ncbi:MAG: helix-turn-helix transcriptional regulator [Firmicutes bacterium]|nr:helix-turn-helix transcriptional regulator [Bacillota bacterium]
MIIAMFVSAAIIGILAVLMCIILIKNWSAGNKIVWSCIRNFLILNIIESGLYLYFEGTRLAGSGDNIPFFLRVLDIELLVFMNYFLNSYIREKSMLSDRQKHTLKTANAVIVGLCAVIAFICFGFLMNGQYAQVSVAAGNAAVVLEIALCLLQTGNTILHLTTACREIPQKQSRVFIIIICLAQVLNGLWNGSLIICEVSGLHTGAMYEVIDTTSIMMIITNICIVLLLYTEDFSPLFVAAQNMSDEPARSREEVLEERMDYIAETHSLTKREREVMELAYKGMTNYEMAEELCISKYTIKRHMYNIYEKLGISTRVDLIHMIDR